MKSPWTLSVLGTHSMVRFGGGNTMARVLVPGSLGTNVDKKRNLSVLPCDKVL